MKSHRVSRRFTRLSDVSLNCFASSVVLGMTGNPTFPDPLIPLAQLDAARQAFLEACMASELGGRAATSQKNARRAALLGMLRSQAGYVEGVCRADLSGLLSSGFTNVNPNCKPAPLATPAILAIVNQRSRALTLRVRPVANARNYQTQMRAGGGDWREVGFYNQARRMEVGSLTPGTVYEFRVRALGGSTGVGDWSPAAGRMSL